MNNQPTITHTRTHDGTRSRDLDTWLDGTPHGWIGNRLVLFCGNEAPTRPHPGWLLIRWSDHTVTTATPHVTARVYGPHGLAGRLQRAEATLERVRKALDDESYGAPEREDVITAIRAALDDPKEH